MFEIFIALFIENILYILDKNFLYFIWKYLIKSVYIIIDKNTISSIRYLLGYQINYILWLSVARTRTSLLSLD